MRRFSHRLTRMGTDVLRITAEVVRHGERRGAPVVICVLSAFVVKNPTVPEMKKGQ